MEAEKIDEEVTEDVTEEVTEEEKEVTEEVEDGEEGEEKVEEEEPEWKKVAAETESVPLASHLKTKRKLKGQVEDSKT